MGILDIPYNPSKVAITGGTVDGVVTRPNTPSSKYYKFFLPGKQFVGSGMAADHSSAGNPAMPVLGFTDGASGPWANKGYITTNNNAAPTSASVQNAHMVVPTAQMQFDLVGDSMILSMLVNKPATTIGAGNDYIFGNYDNTPGKGLRIYAPGSAPGAIGILLHYGAGSTFVATTTAQVTPFDGTDHVVTFAIDGVARQIFIFVDGALMAASKANAYPANGSTLSAQDFAIGAANGAVNGFSNYVKTNGVHMLVFPGSGLPLNVGSIARRLAANSQSVITDSEILMSTKRVAIAVLGQSNEYGGGNTFPTSTQGTGYPYLDAAVSQVATMWPHLSELLGRSNICAYIQNTANGSTSLPRHWVGQIVTAGWVASTQYAQGDYLVANGSLFKATAMASGVTGNSGSSQPTWPGSGSVTDNNITWTFQRAATGADVPGKIFTSADAEFDPNGYIKVLSRTSLAGIVPALDAFPNSIEKWVLVSLGQTDASFNTPQADYYQAYVNATDYFLSKGYKVAAGFTCYDAVAGAEAVYQSNLLPALAQVITHYTGNSNVIAGANLRTVLGILTAGTNYRSAAGLNSDNLHMNNTAMLRAAEAWYSALKTANWA